MISAKIVKKKKTEPTTLEKFKKITFPVVRKVFSHLIAQEVISVQPMSMPTGLLTWLDYGYGTRKPVKTPQELERLIKMAWAWTARFPVGSTVYLNKGGLMGDDTIRPEALVIRTEGFPLSELSVVGFLANESKDDKEFFYIQDLIEYKDFIEEFDKNEPKRDAPV